MSDAEYESQENRIIVNCSDELKEQWKEERASMSGSIRKMMRAVIEYEEKHGIEDDLEATEIIVLKTYLNAIEKNISQMKRERDKLQKKIDELEEDEGDEVLIEVNLEMTEVDL